MKKIFFVFIAIIVASYAAGSLSFAQYISQSIPKEDRIESIEVVEITRKVDKAKGMIEEKGELAIIEFTKNSGKWLGSEQALYIVEATEESENKGRFVVFPSPENVSADSLYMPMVNGKPLIHHVQKKMDTKKKASWFKFVDLPSETEQSHAGAIAISPDGNTYVIAAGIDNFIIQKFFITKLLSLACDLIEEKGEKAFTVFQDKNSIFQFKDTYVYVADKNGTMLLDPGNPEYNGVKLVDFPSKTPGYKYPVFGKTMEEALSLAYENKIPHSPAEFTQKWNEVVLENDSTWSAYVVAKPGEKELSRKVSYNKRVTGPDGKKYIVGCGIYLAK